MVTFLLNLNHFLGLFWALLLFNFVCFLSSYTCALFVLGHQADESAGK
jgi:hypothetical protein